MYVLSGTEQLLLPIVTVDVGWNNGKQTKEKKIRPENGDQILFAVRHWFSSAASAVSAGASRFSIARRRKDEVSAEEKMSHSRLQK